MPTRKNVDVETPVEEVGALTPGAGPQNTRTSDPAEEVTRRAIVAREASPAEPVDYVPREEFDQTVKYLQDKFSEFEVRLADVELIKAQPEGAVQFFQTPPYAPSVPESPAYPQQASGGTAPWYSPENP